MKVNIYRKRVVLLAVLISITQCVGLMYLTESKSPFEEYDDPEIVSTLLNNEYTWEVKRSMGIFSTNNIHSGNQVRYRVREANSNMSNYLVDEAYNNWTDTRFYFGVEPVNASLFLVPRDWGKLMSETIIPQIAIYFCRHPMMIEIYRDNHPGILDESLTGQELLNGFNQNPNFWETNLGIDIFESALFQLDKYEMTTFKYRTVWYLSRMITVIDLAIELDENNYERLTYTRAEGILLSRESSVFILNGTRKDFQGISRDNPFPLSGTYSVELTEFSEEFIVSFWHYVIWFAIIFSIIIATIFAISITLAMKERKFRTMDY